MDPNLNIGCSIPIFSLVFLEVIWLPCSFIQGSPCALEQLHAFLSGLSEKSKKEKVQLFVAPLPWRSQLHGAFGGSLIASQNRHIKAASSFSGEYIFFFTVANISKGKLKVYNFIISQAIAKTEQIFFQKRISNKRTDPLSFHLQIH